jgi:hypothetical protein
LAVIRHRLAPVCKFIVSNFNLELSAVGLPGRAAGHLLGEGSAQISVDLRAPARPAGGLAIGSRSDRLRVQADRLLPPALAGVDSYAEDRRSTVSVFNGRDPTIETFDDPEQESEAVGNGSRACSNQEFSRTKSACSSARPRKLRRSRNTVKQAEELGWKAAAFGPRSKRILIGIGTASATVSSSHFLAPADVLRAVKIPLPKRPSRALIGL